MDNSLIQMGVFKMISREVQLVLQHQRTSLDYPCDFCGTNSYANFHFSVDKELFNICDDCLAKARKTAINKIQKRFKIRR